MSVAALQDYTFTSKYAGYLEEMKRRETWSEAIDRFCDMFLEKYNDKPAITPYVESVRVALKKKRVLITR